MVAELGVQHPGRLPPAGEHLLRPKEGEQLLPGQEDKQLRQEGVEEVLPEEPKPG